jgi:hypothetical protein
MYGVFAETETAVPPHDARVPFSPHYKMHEASPEKKAWHGASVKLADETAKLSCE